MFWSERRNYIVVYDDAYKEHIGWATIRTKIGARFAHIRRDSIRQGGGHIGLGGEADEVSNTYNARVFFPALRALHGIAGIDDSILRSADGGWDTAAHKLKDAGLRAYISWGGTQWVVTTREV